MVPLAIANNALHIRRIVQHLTVEEKWQSAVYDFAMILIRLYCRREQYVPGIKSKVSYFTSVNKSSMIFKDLKIVYAYSHNIKGILWFQTVVCGCVYTATQQHYPRSLDFIREIAYIQL